MATTVRQRETIKRVPQDDGTVVEEREPVWVFTHCFNPGCTRFHDPQQDLNFERRVPGLREQTDYTYTDRGGDMPGVENSTVSFFVADVQDSVCEECGEPANVSESPAEKLAGQNIGPGSGLKGVERAAALAAAKVADEKKGELDEMRSKMERLERLLERQGDEAA